MGSKSQNYHRAKSYMDLEHLETAVCVLMYKIVDDKMIKEWVPLDEAYDRHFKDDWYCMFEINREEETNVQNR